MNPLKTRKPVAILISGAKLLERFDKDPLTNAAFIACRLLHKMNVNVDINSRTFNCQLY